MSNQASVPGWYPDPYDPSRLRYWDGAAWSEATAPAAGSGSGEAAQGPPLAYGQPAGPGGPGMWVDSSNPLGDVGDWLSRTFSVVIDRLVAVLVLLWAIPVVGYSLAALLALASIRDLTWIRATDELTGFNAPQLVVAGIVLLVTLVVLAVSYLMSVHQLHAAHNGRRPPLSRSASVALRRLPRAIVYGLALGLGATVIYAVLLGGPLVAAIAVDGKVALLLLLTIPLLIGVFVYLGVRLSLFWVATTVAPTGTNPVATTWRATAGRFWAVLGRLLVLLAIVYLAQTITNFALQVGLTPVVQSSAGLETAPDGELVVNGQRFDEIDTIEVDDFLPHPVVVFLVVALYTATQAAGQALFISGTSGLYVRLQGPDAEAGSEPAAVW